MKLSSFEVSQFRPTDHEFHLLAHVLDHEAQEMAAGFPICLYGELFSGDRSVVQDKDAGLSITAKPKWIFSVHMVWLIQGQVLEERATGLIRVVDMYMKTSEQFFSFEFAIDIHSG